MKTVLSKTYKCCVAGCRKFEDTRMITIGICTFWLCSTHHGQDTLKVIIRGKYYSIVRTRWYHYEVEN